MLKLCTIQPHFEDETLFVWAVTWFSPHREQRNAFPFLWTTIFFFFFFFYRGLISFIKKGSAKELLLPTPAVKLPPILLPWSKRKGHQVTDPKFQLVTQITDLPTGLSSWPFVFSLQWRMRHSLNQNDSPGQFYKTNRRLRVLVTPVFLPFPHWARLFPTHTGRS